MMWGAEQGEVRGKDAPVENHRGSCIVHCCCAFWDQGPSVLGNVTYNKVHYKRLNTELDGICWVKESKQVNTPWTIYSKCEKYCKEQLLVSMLLVVQNTESFILKIVFIFCLSIPSISLTNTG